MTERQQLELMARFIVRAINDDDGLLVTEQLTEKGMAYLHACVVLGVPPLWKEQA